MTQQADDPRRDFLIKTLTMGLIASSGILTLEQAALAMGEVPRKLPDGRSIFRLEGDVSVDDQPANLNTAITARSTVRTSVNSSVIFVVAGDAFILRENSELTMGSQDGLIIQGMRLLSGALLSVFAERKEPHTIETTTATVGIRGTGIYAETDPEKSYICTCYGRTLISSQVDPNQSEEVEAEHHDRPLYILASPQDGNLIVPAPFINHTDAELALIEELVGRTTPFAYSADAYEVPRNRNY